MPALLQRLKHLTKSRDASGHEHAADGRFGTGGSGAAAKPASDSPKDYPRPEAVTTVADLHEHAETKATGWLAKMGSKVKAAAGAVLSKVKAGLTKQYQVLEKRYGRKTAIAIMAGGCALGLGTPLAVVPGSTMLGAVPFAAVAEVYLQAKRLVSGKTPEKKSGDALSLEDVYGLAEEWLEHAHELTDEHKGAKGLAGSLLRLKQWNEADHPRGQSENAGEFAPSSGGSSGAPPEESPNKQKPKKSQADVSYGKSKPYQQAEIDEVLTATLGTDDAEEVASVVGAPDDAEVTVDWGWSEDQRTRHSKITIDHKDFKAVRTIRKTKDGKTYIQNEEFWVKGESQGKGLGADVFARQVENAVDLGVAFIKCHAAKENPRDPEKPHNGYYTWPRFGYDMALDDDYGIAEEDEGVYAQARTQFPAAKTLLDVMSTTEGREWWKKNGTDALNMKFDLSEGSRSMEIFQAYLNERSKKSTSTTSKKRLWSALGRIAKRSRSLKSAFEEDKHPRDHGQFSSKPGASGGAEKKPSATGKTGDVARDPGVYKVEGKLHLVSHEGKEVDRFDAKFVPHLSDHVGAAHRETTNKLRSSIESELGADEITTETDATIQGEVDEYAATFQRRADFTTNAAEEWLRDNGASDHDINAFKVTAEELRQEAQAAIDQITTQWSGDEQPAPDDIESELDDCFDRLEDTTRAMFDGIGEAVTEAHDAMTARDEKQDQDWKDEMQGHVDDLEEMEPDEARAYAAEVNAGYDEEQEPDAKEYTTNPHRLVEAEEGGWTYENFEDLDEWPGKAPTA